MKTCSRCGDSKSLDQFSGCASASDGLRSYCRSCAKTINSKYYAANTNKVKAISAKYYAANPDKKKLSNAKWRTANPGWVRVNACQWAANNLEAMRIHAHNRRARKRANGGRLSVGLAQKLYKLQRGKCACGCLQPLGDDYHLDHRMPLALGGTNTDDNIQLLRQRCNNQKYNKHPIDYMQSKGYLL